MSQAVHSSKRVGTGRARGEAGRRKAIKAGGLAVYLERSQSPLAALWLVVPMLILHEAGVRRYGTVAGGLLEYRIAAFGWMARFFGYFGASGRYLPALAVAAILLSWHVARGDRWRLDPRVGPGMALESMLLALPLLGVQLLFGGRVGPGQGGDWHLLAALYLGAGVYEELVFRLAGFALLSFLLMDLGQIPRRWGTPLVVLLAAVGFSAYHMLGVSPYTVPALVLIGLRGIYYGIIFMERGFGVSAGVHAAYDLFLLAQIRLTWH